VGFFEMLQTGEKGDLYRKKTSHTTVQFSNNRLKKINSGESNRDIIRLIKNGQLGLVENTKPDNQVRLIELAREASEFGPRVDFSLPGPGRPGTPDIWDSKLEDLRLDDLIQPAINFIEEATKYHPDLQVEISARKESNIIELENSSGFFGEFKQSQVKILLGLRLIEGKNLLNSYSFPYRTHWQDINWEQERENLLQKIDWGRKNVPLPPGNYPVLFLPETFGDILHPVEACLNGQSVARGLSPWEGKLGQELFSREISFFNQGLLDKGPNSKPFDREGVSCSSFPLIEKGELKSYFLDLETAETLSLPPTGTAGENGPEINNLIMEPGNKKLEEMLGEIDEGILVAGTMGAWAGNPYGGQVSGNISLGYKIKNGKIQGRIKDAMFSLNVFQALKNRVAAIGSEREWVENMFLPAILIEPVSISIKG